jgi:hypothetical protein
MTVPKQLIVRYEDGSQKELDFDKLDETLQSELAKLGLCPPPGEIGSAKHYILMQWKNGWQEVIGSNKDTVDFLRYFVIRRIEHRGRISFEVGDEYPIFYVLRRLPMDLNRLLIVSKDRVSSYDLSTAIERHEGTFEAGGKLEYVKWDRTDSKFPSEMSDAPKNLDETLSALREALKNKGIDTQDLLGADPSRRIESYREIAKGMGIRGYQRQADVYGFIEFLLSKLGNA